MGKVEPQPVRLHQRTGLMHMVPQHLFQCRIQQMRGAVGAADGLTALHVDGGGDGVSLFQLAGLHHAMVQELPRLVLLDVLDGEYRPVQGNGAVVCHLSAHLRVKRRFVQHKHTLGALDDGVPQFILRHDGQHRAGIRVVVIAGKQCGRCVKAQINARPCHIAQRLPGFSGPDALLLHQLAESGLVHLHILFLQHLRRQVQRETIGVVKLESVRAGEQGFVLCLVGRQHFRVNFHARIQRLEEILFLRPHHLGDISFLFRHVGIGGLVDLGHRGHHLVQERPVHSQQLSVTRGAAQQAAQHIAPALVAGQHAVADHHDGGTDMVRDNPEGHVGLVALFIVGAGDLADLIRNVHHGVHIKEGRNTLTGHRQPLKTHAGVDVLIRHLLVVALAVIDKLGEDVVPDFDIPVAVAAHGALRPTAAVFLAPVIVNLGAGTAGAGAVLPEVVRLAEAEDTLSRDIHVLVPNFKSLFVLFVNGGIQPIRLQPRHLGQKLPAHGNGLLLEVITEGEIAQHLEIGAVAGGFADIFNVARADALLAGANPVAGRLFLPGKPGFHGGHAAVNQQKACVVVGNQGKAGQAQMALAFKIAQEHLPQLVQSIYRMCHICFLRISQNFSSLR